MRIIGQNINSSSPEVARVLEESDTEALLAMAVAQARNGADLLDINADLCEDPQNTLLWAVKVLDAAGYALSIDSASAERIAFVYRAAGLVGGLANSVRLDQKTAALLLPMAAEQGAGVVAMPIEGARLPASAGEYMRNAARMLELLEKYGVPHSKTYMDILVMPAYVTGRADPLENARGLREKYPHIHIIAGISNVSHGLPQRRAVNRLFLRRCIENGVDSFILDALDAPAVRVCKDAGRSQK